jgi:hypothetical protein
MAKKVKQKEIDELRDVMKDMIKQVCDAEIITEEKQKPSNKPIQASNVKKNQVQQINKGKKLPGYLSDYIY